jgi:hypothetical protein
MKERYVLTCEYKLDKNLTLQDIDKSCEAQSLLVIGNHYEHIPKICIQMHILRI